MCVQSSVSAEVSVEKRSETVTESVLGRMIALGETGKGDLGRHASGRLRK
jgi:hypothetical protein